MELKESLEYLVGLGEETITNFTDSAGNEYVSEKFIRVLPDYPEPIMASTLTSVIEYIRRNPDDRNDMMVMIDSHSRVSVVGPLDDFGKREVYLVADALIPEVLRFGEFYNGETFNIALQARFVHTPDIDILSNIAGNITESSARTSVDDGISQSVVMKTGIATVANVTVPKKVSLKPFRTFTEIPQPESEFVFRVKEGPVMAIFEADGGAWKNSAILEIRKFLDEALNETGTVILA